MTMPRLQAANLIVRFIWLRNLPMDWSIKKSILCSLFPRSRRSAKAPRAMSPHIRFTPVHPQNLKPFGGRNLILRPRLFS